MMEINVGSRTGQETLAYVVVVTNRQKDFYFSCLEKLSQGADGKSEDCLNAFAELNKISAGMAMGVIKPENLEAFRFILLEIKLRSRK